MNRAAWIALTLAVMSMALSACGGAAYRDETYVEPEREDPSALAEEQGELERQLSEALARPEPDCASACEPSARICALSERICAIAERHPGDGALADGCEDANARCESARERVAERCTCE